MKRDEARASIQRHSKSFALAARLLPSEVQHGAVVLYAYCRRADDAIDLSPPGEQLARLAGLREELTAVYAGALQPDPLLAEFQRVTRLYSVPREYLEELLLGMEMDVQRVRYNALPELMLYAYRVAGVVGLMMCHVMGVREAAALRHAAHLGMAMQLSNIARDVREDWDRGRLYLPQDLLTECGVAGLHAEPGRPLPPSAAGGLAQATERLLQHADSFYRSGDAGLPQLSLRCALAIRAARLVYSEISQRVRDQACDPFAPRAVVSKRRKLQLVGRAAWLTAAELPSFWARPEPRTPAECVTDPERFFSVGH
jgi:phytoene synthase